MKLMVSIHGIMLATTFSALQSAELIQKNLEKLVHEQEIAHQKLLDQMAELALTTLDIDLSELTVEEMGKLKKKLVQLLDKELKKEESKQPAHGRHSSI